MGPPPGWRHWTRSPGWRARICGTPRGPKRCAAWATPGGHATSCGRRWSWRRPPPNAGSCPAASPRCRRSETSRGCGVLSHGPSSSSMQNQETGIEEDEMTTTLTASRPAAVAAAPAPQAGPRRRPRVTLIVGSLAGFMIGLDATVVTTALPTIHATLHASASALGWTVSAYSLAFAALILTGTALGDKFGRRRVFLAGFAVFTLASAACALAPSVAALIAARAVQGAGGGIATPLSLVLITEAFPAQRRGAVVGAWGAIAGVAVGLGPVIGGAIVQGIAWQWVFWVNVPVGIALVTLGRRVLAEGRGPARRLDPAGLLLATAAVFAVTDALLRGPLAGWRSAQVLSLFGIGTALATAFVLTERRLAHPMIPPRLLTNPMLRAAVTTRFLLFATILGAAFMVPQYLQLAHGFSPLHTGLALLPFTGPMMLIAPIAGKAADRVGERLPIVAGFLLAATGFTLLGLTATATGGYLTVAAPL